MRKPLLWALIVSMLAAATAFAQSTAPQAQSPQNPPAAENVVRRGELPLSQAVVKTIFFSHLSQPTEIQDVQNALRTVLEFTRVTPVASNNALIIRGTPEQVAMAEKLIAELDRARPQGNRPPPSPPAGISSYRLDFTLTEFEDGKKVNTRSYSTIMQRGAGRDASIRVGSRVPVATGSFQPGSSGNTPLVNTQFQYIDVGVNIDCTLSGTDDDLSLFANVEVSGMSEPRAIGGISQPVIRQTRSKLQGAITAGRPTVIASLDQVDSPRRMEIGVTATKLK